MGAQDSGGWAVSSSASASCGYNNGGYQIWESTTNQFQPCMAQNLSGGNIAFQATMTMTSAPNNGGGLIFRQIYRFHVSTGSYDLVTTTAANPTLTYQQNSGIHTDGGQSITLTVIAEGADIYLYANGALLTHLVDNSSSNGRFGLFAYDRTSPTTAIFTNVKVWLL